MQFEGIKGIKNNLSKNIKFFQENSRNKRRSSVNDSNIEALNADEIIASIKNTNLRNNLIRGSSFDVSVKKNYALNTADEIITKELDNETEEIEKRKTSTLPVIEKKIFPCKEYVNNIDSWNPTGYISHEPTIDEVVIPKKNTMEADKNNFQWKIVDLM